MNDIFDVSVDRSLLIAGAINESLINKIIEKLFYLNQKEGTIILQINSAGGCVRATQTLYENLLLSRNKVLGVVTGRCYSGAAILLQACHKRYATPSSSFGLHYIAYNFSFEILPGKTFDHYIEYLKGEFDRLHVNNQMIRNFLKRRMKLNEEEIHDLLNKEKELNAQEALKYGLIDEIIDV